MDTNGIVWRKRQEVRYLVFPRLEKAGLLVHAFTSRPLDLGFGRRGRAEVLEGRRKVCRSLGINFSLLTVGEQVHGVRVSKVGREEMGKGALSREGAISHTDGLISCVPGIPLTIFTADCVPLFIMDPVRKAIGLAHAGWRGTLRGIAGITVARMEAEFGSRPGDLVVALGPSIGPCCYRVGEEVITAFRARFPHESFISSDKSAGEKWTLDLREANRIQLRKARVKDENIINSQMCTGCHNDILFSRRRDGPTAGRMMALMMLKDKEKWLT